MNLRNCHDVCTTELLILYNKNVPLLTVVRWWKYVLHYMFRGIITSSSGACTNVWSFNLKSLAPGLLQPVHISEYRMFIIMCIMVGLVLDGLFVLCNDNPRTELDGFTSHICTHTPTWTWSCYTSKHVV